jgi:cell division protein FtsL
MNTTLLKKTERDIFLMLATGTDPNAIFTWIKNHKLLSINQKVSMINYTINEYDRQAEDLSRMKWLD